MTLSHGWNLPEQHLLPDAIVAFVDGELAPVPAQRAAAHLQQCAACSAEATAQRQASGLVRAAGSPEIPAGLLSTLREIPTEVELPSGPDDLAVAPDGQVVMVQRPEKVQKSARLGSGPVLGSSAPLGTNPLGSSAAALGVGSAHHQATRRAAQGAGVVVSGIVLGALALTLPQMQGQTGSTDGTGTGASVPARRPAGVQVARAELGGGAVRGGKQAPPAPSGSRTPSPSSSAPSVTVPVATHPH